MKNKSYKDNYKSTMRTIITNAVCGRAIHPCQTTVYISSEDNVEPDRILGCAVTNAEINGSKFEEFSDDNINIRINGEFEVHVWYEANGDTNVSKSYSKFSEVIPVESLEGEKYYQQDYFNKRIIAWINKNPVSQGAMIVNKSGLPTIAIQVAYELGVEVMGEAKINILSYSLDEKEKDIIFDSLLEDDHDDDDVD
ncbi:outer spore coat protein CotE [Crassaminicella thermophila]|uniref:Outer spore coat protein CotE n=1 Tax=Crassaminicella thermophila TaxID=2599308 RepID=A0A5C0S9X7_CRATE|nr:outer spore coat protein CotE [Crassaminicella thermophila]QEK10921.1 outer spore coat protein CotE [Crassaminicella thermophila]